MKYFPPDIDSCLNKESLKKTLWGYPEQNEILTHEKCGIVINSGEQSEKSAIKNTDGVRRRPRMRQVKLREDCRVAPRKGFFNF